MQREAEIGIRKATSGSRELQAGRSAWRRCHLSYKVTDSALVPRGSGIHTLVCKQTHTVRNHLHWFLFLLSNPKPGSSTWVYPWPIFLIRMLWTEVFPPKVHSAEALVPL